MTRYDKRRDIMANKATGKRKRDETAMTGRVLLLYCVIVMVVAGCTLWEGGPQETPAPTATPAPSRAPTLAPTTEPTDDPGSSDEPDSSDEPQPSDATITVEGVQVSAERVVIRGTTTLPDGECVSTELWADGAPQSWWPSDGCASVSDGGWELEVALEADEVLKTDVQYMVRAYQPGGADVVSTFPFDVSSPPAPSDTDPALVLPESAEPLHRATADLDGDGTDEEIILTGWGGGAEGGAYDFLQLFVVRRTDGEDYAVAWQSEQLPTDRGEALEVRDVNGDDVLEVLSVQAVGASGEVLYVLGRTAGGYDWLRPQGGQFDGQDAFGDVGVSVEDRDDDGVDEILAWYGPAARQADVYAWDGEAYVYRETLGGLEVSYESVEIAEAGLSLEVPAGWTSVDSASWTAPENDRLRLGVKWADLEPPQEPEAVLLPQPAQILESVPVELPWASARRFVVEVYGEAEEDGEQAPVVSVEAHVLAVVEMDGGRRAIDVYAAAPSAEELTTLEPILQHATKTLELE